MSGDHNMNQFTYGKAISGANPINQATSQIKRNLGIGDVGLQMEETEEYKSQIERQCEEMQATINLLKATVETLRNRLVPVMADAPMRVATGDGPPVASPLGLSIHQYRYQTSSVIDELVHIIESLEI